MEKVCAVKVQDLIVEGFEGDYVFETIKKNKTFYENDLLVKWLSYLEKSRVILDIGANLGNHTLFWAKNTKYEKIFSFEPFRPNYERLVHNIENNSLQNIISINKGVGQKEGFSNVLNFSEENYGGTTLDTSIDNEGDIEITSIDCFVADTNISEVDFVKIDTEGFEKNVLDGMQNVLKKFHPDLWIEVSHESFRPVIEQLQGMNYVIADISGFNILFLHPDRHQHVKTIENMRIYDDLFLYLEKVNRYYQNYLKVKNWFQTKSDKLNIAEKRMAELSLQLNAANQKYKEMLDNYEAAKGWVTARNEKLKEAESMVLDLRESLKQTQIINQNLQQSLQESKNTVSNLQQELDKTEFRLQEKEKEHDRLMQQKVALKEHDKLTKKELCSCLKDYDLIIMNTEQLMSKITRLEVQTSALMQKNNELQAKIDIIDNSKIGRLGIKLYHLYKRIQNR